MLDGTVTHPMPVGNCESANCPDHSSLRLFSEKLFIAAGFRYLPKSLKNSGDHPAPSLRTTGPAWGNLKNPADRPAKVKKEDIVDEHGQRYPIRAWIPPFTAASTGRDNLSKPLFLEFIFPFLLP